MCFWASSAHVRGDSITQIQVNGAYLVSLKRRIGLQSGSMDGDTEAFGRLP